MMLNSKLSDINKFQKGKKLKRINVLFANLQKNAQLFYKIIKHFQQRV